MISPAAPGVYRSKVQAVGASALVPLIAIACGFVVSRTSLISPALLLGVVVIGALICVALLVGVQVRGLAVGVVVGGQLLIGAFIARGLLPASATLLLDAIAVFVLVVSLWTTHESWCLSLTLMLVYIGFVLVQCFNSDLPSISYGLRGARLLVLPAVLMIALARLELSRRDLILIVGIATVGWIVNVEFALRQMFVGFTSAELALVEHNESTFRVGSAIRLIGAMRSNQDFAFLAAVVVPLIAVLLLHMRTRFSRLIVGIIFAASLLVLFGSLVRSGLAGGVIGALVATTLSVTTRTSRRRLAVGAAIIAAFFVLVVAAGPSVILPAEQAKTIGDRVSSVFSPGSDHSVNARVSETWPAAYSLASQHPLGGGSGSAGPVSQSSGGAPFGAVVPDNGYLLILVQLGFAGLALFFAMLIAIGLELFRAARQGVTMAAAALGSLIALMVGMITSSFWDLTSPAVLFAVIIGLGLRAGRVAEGQQARESAETATVPSPTTRLSPSAWTAAAVGQRPKLDPPG